MARYKITFKKPVAKDLRSIPKKDIKRILGQIDLLANDPRSEGCIKLSGQEQYRVRIGLYRIIYEIQNSKLIIQVVKIGHRSSIYKATNKKH
ncbi:type II toxin-antitoxin system RelE/ParE family toxin [Haliea sp. AH-315-K21]|uniref:Type II toxin-antitoxin system mRNA interferase toxin, RelE/StbE family n=1 Tax=SAR86 cluster bacterium TaxID=2030880 RepID=A0A2A5CEW8_9GAMM|nr:type II toxin-antitoxin system RelE/ParE family toxin [Haliea sp. AH-315-K21]MBN4076024.1 type II toxin-antitoxin system RelE/ParE family toxin [Gammaproteobacteria bacterium AH-315-E17]PCJ42045.1 MAG: type II toxin-antitoxin system mRNA interferase toxin, RelE/StbE family [SAR86 cluster bacterium]